MAIARLTREAHDDERLAGGPRLGVVCAIALAGFAAAGASMALALTSDHVDEPGLQAALMDWITLPYVLAGCIAWRRRPESRFGPLMIAAGFTMFLSSLAWANAPLPKTIGQAFDLVPAAVFLHLFLAFPSGRLEHWFERALVIATYVTAFGLELVSMALGGYGPDNMLEIVAAPGAALTLLDVQLVAISVFCLTGVAVLIVRRRRGQRPLRRSVALLVDSFALALVMIAVLFLTGAFEGPAFETIRRITFVTLGAAPVAFLIGLLDARLARSAVGDLLLELPTDPAPPDLRDAFARALRDPSLSVAYWLPEFESWADLDGREVQLAGSDERRVTTLLDREGAPLAALVHDPALADEPELLDAVSAAARIALENARLHAELSARLEELRGSRVRLIEAGQRERQRLERNLHDGAQQRLVALSLELTLLKKRLAADPVAGSRIDHARDEIALSLAELRDVARGLHPAVLSGHGLSVALESLAARATVPVDLRVDLAERLPEPLEVAAYYLVSESLANIGKHAQATSATIDVARSNGRVIVEIVDDGVGGADTERGSGLRGLADRVEALDGRLRVWTPVGHGTRVRAEIPCG
jgi:signal transduction histidine kinase